MKKQLKPSKAYLKELAYLNSKKGHGKPCTFEFAKEFNNIRPDGNQIPKEYLGRDGEDYYSWAVGLQLDGDNDQDLAENFIHSHKVFEILEFAEEIEEIELQLAMLKTQLKVYDEAAFEALPDLLKRAKEALSEL